VSEPLGPPEFGPQEGLRLPPWEEWRRWGFLNALFLTIKGVLLRPGEFFGRMPARVGIWQPLLFALLIGVTAAFFQWMWALAGSSLDALLGEELDRLPRGPLVYGLFWLFSPALVLLDVLITTILVHLGLLLAGGNRLGIEASYRVVCYAQAPGLLVAVPFCGGVLAVVWHLVILIVGLQRIHATDAWRAVLAVFLPLLLCLGAFVSFLVVVVGLGTLL
jgi:hypothetical protein